jgi:hypothetical protein
MLRSTTGLFVTIASCALLGGCAKDNVQPISGKVALQTFDGPVTTVSAVRPGGTPVVARVGLDGAFQIAVPRGKGYHLEFAGPSRVPYLVFPRTAGSLTWTFDVRGRGTRFDVGTVRYVGDPKGMPVSFVTRQKQTAAEPDAGAKEEEDECEDGKNEKTGAVCVDDDDDKGKKHEECDDDDADDCVNGTNPKTGTPCTPPPAPGSAAVADHNLPSVMGTCQDDEDDDKDDDDKDHDHKD